METNRRVQLRIPRSRWLPVVGIGLTLLVFAGAIAFGTLQLREKTRSQIVIRGAEILHGVAQMVQVTLESDRELGGQIENLTDQFALALQLSQLNQFNGVIATRVFGPDGQFGVALPPNVAPTTVPRTELDQLKAFRPVSRFLPRARLADVYQSKSASVRSTADAPLLEVFIPLHRQDRKALLGVVQFVMDGQDIASQFAALDRNLTMQAALAFGVGGLIIAVALSWTFRRLNSVNRQLLDRTHRLQRANEELALVAKTSAVGAISAHLVHGLSSPLSGLQEVVARGALGDLPEEEWAGAAQSASRMQELIGEILRVLGEEDASVHYEIKLGELSAILQQKLMAPAKSAKVELRFDTSIPISLPNRESNLVVLILENLLRNAIQATPPGSSVTLSVAPADDGVDFEVRDQGPGVSPEMQLKLFTPLRSAKRGGHGIGLAICKQLASHLNATLELKSTSPQGSVFVLRLPRGRLAG